MQLIPVIPQNVLFIGNSLLFGNGDFGMCATDYTKDYYYYVSEFIKSKNSSASFNKLVGVDFEGATNDQAVTDWINNNLETKKSKDYNLIVVQLGDNVNTTDKLETFKISCAKLLKYLRVTFPNARVCWVGAWYTTDEKQSIISKACDITGCKFVNIQYLNTVENQGKIGDVITHIDGTETTVTSSGVASHPGNLGMKAIADEIIKKLF